MKKNVIMAALVACLSIPAVVAAAPDGTITFNGTISSQTCDVSVNNGSKDAKVTLPNVISSLLASQGQVAGATSFTIDLKNCATSDGKVRAFFQAGSNVDSASGNLKNNGTAAEVQVQLLDADGNVLKAGDESQRAGTANQQTLNDGAATLSYAAQYYATGKAGPGSVATAVEYSVDYF